MKQLTIKDIRSLDPCYDPVRHLPEDWTGTALDLLALEHVPFVDQLWCVLRAELVSKKLMRLFAVWAYRDTLNWIPNPDPRSVEVANVAERFANDEATVGQLEAAWSAAKSATWSAKSAAASAAWLAAESAAESAWSAAKSATEVRQKNKLIEMIQEENYV